MRTAICAAAGGTLLLLATAAHAQPRPGQLTLEAIAATTVSSSTPRDPFVSLDFATTVRIGAGFDAVVRPYARRMPGGDWDAMLYQLQVRYQSATRVPVRVDAGVITSPLGLATLELRPDVNPTVGYPSYYFVPLPAFDAGRDRVQLMSGGYPLGAIVSVSGEHWDARAGVTDSTPARSRKVFAGGPDAMRQLVAGGGLTPRTGLRVGAAFARGGYRRTNRLANGIGSAGTAPAHHDERATVLNLEAEYAFGYTKFSGEWVRDRFDTSTGPAVAAGYYVQAVHSLSPRVFTSGRVLRVSSPVQAGSSREQRTMGTAELTAAYRLTPEWTMKAGYQGTRRFGSDAWAHAAVASLVWSQRWFR
jgi:hypothetical protein